MNIIKIYLFVVAMLAVVPSMGQTSLKIREAQNDHQSTRSILRSKSDGEVINCKSGGSMSVFSLVTEQQQFDERVLESVIVNDFVIDNDSVFFCGFDYTSGDYVAGFFDIMEFFYLNGAFNLIMGMGAPTTDLVTYLDSQNRRHIMCVGYNAIVSLCDTGSSWTMDRMFCDGLEQYHDITTADGYVVAAGIYNNSDNENVYALRRLLIVRIFDKDDPFSASSPCWTGHVFNDISNYGDRMWLEYDSVVAVGVPGTNSVTLAGTMLNTPEENPWSSAVTRSYFAQIDIDMAIANNPNAMTAALEVSHAYFHQGNGLMDVVWDDVRQTYIVVRGYNTPGLYGQNSNFFELPYSEWNLQTNVTVVYDTSSAQMLWQGAAVFDQALQYRYIVSGIAHDSYEPMHCKYAVWALGSNHECFPSTTSTVTSVPTVGMGSAGSASVDPNAYANITTRYAISNQNVLEVECQF